MFLVTALFVLSGNLFGVSNIENQVVANSKEISILDREGLAYGKCHLFNTKRKSLSFNGINSSFKFSVEGEDAGLEENELSFINKDNLINVHSQLTVANQLFQNVLMLEDPLSSQRYDKAKFINITIEYSDKIFGTAYDEVVTNNELGLSNCFIGMKISNKVNAIKNVTPAHELFHLYQNSAMMFKQSWLSEGTARWSESLIKEGTGEEEVLPETKEELLEVMDSSYGASKFWTRLFRLIDQNDTFTVPNDLDTITYSNNKSVLQDNRAYGTRFIKVLFDELNFESNHVSKLKGWDRYGWKEKDQKDPKLNPYIWRAVKRAVSKVLSEEQQSEELRKCMEIEL
ncbi:hypothetical protein [Otariodibacter sp.]|uniref:hypothetical protein n=1 Tax=Otariodibacter sp. TaxID=3030919 RepID=UPI002637483F|nr:hypothetical protein [Otariodibacter sp.]